MYASRAHSPEFVVDAAGAVYRVVSDQFGSPLLIVNVADVNDVLLKAEYSAFAERTVLAGDGDALTLRFAGGEFDADTGHRPPRPAVFPRERSSWPPLSGRGRFMLLRAGHTAGLSGCRALHCLT